MLLSKGFQPLVFHFCFDFRFVVESLYCSCTCFLWPEASSRALGSALVFSRSGPTAERFSTRLILATMGPQRIFSTLCQYGTQVQNRIVYWFEVLYFIMAIVIVRLVN